MLPLKMEYSMRTYTQGSYNRGGTKGILYFLRKRTSVNYCIVNHIGIPDKDCTEIKLVEVH